jgi:hypothetical protein
VEGQANTWYQEIEWSELFVKSCMNLLCSAAFNDLMISLQEVHQSNESWGTCICSFHVSASKISGYRGG